MRLTPTHPFSTNQVILMTRTTRQLRSATVLALLLFVFSTAFSAAQAAPRTPYVDWGPGINIRASASTSAKVVGTIPHRRTVGLQCYTTGPTVSGKWGKSNYWYKTTYGGKSGYIADAMVYTGSRTPTVKPCSTPKKANRESKAVSWARDRIGSSNYYLLCERFAENAYGTQGRFATALDGYRWQKANGRIHKDRNAPAGALVYFSNPNHDYGYGHVAVSNGRGGMITSPLVPGQKVHERSLMNGYLGWAYAPPAWGSR